jgi:hypothetical protein
VPHRAAFDIDITLADGSQTWAAHPIQAFLSHEGTGQRDEFDLDIRYSEPLSAAANAANAENGAWAGLFSITCGNTCGITCAQGCIVTNGCTHTCATCGTCNVTCHPGCIVTNGCTRTCLGCASQTCPQACNPITNSCVSCAPSCGGHTCAPTCHPGCGVTNTCTCGRCPTGPGCVHPNP